MAKNTLQETRGRKSKYKEEYNQIVFDLCAKHGAENKQLCKVLKVNENTLYNWGKKFPLFMECIKRGRDYFNLGPVEHALLKRATGYVTYEDTSQQIIDKDTGRIRVLKKRVRKHIAPDPVSIFFYLCNRNSDRWKHRTEVDIHKKVDHTHLIKIEDMSLSKRKELLREGRKQIESIVTNTKQMPKPKKKLKRKKKSTDVKKM